MFFFLKFSRFEVFEIFDRWGNGTKIDLKRVWKAVKSEKFLLPLRYAWTGLLEVCACRRLYLEDNGMCKLFCAIEE
ncbi:hypothetical protein QQP08_004082 [Theobroma cacao]|nr:hypothetical protein QQP08_004082 [Theobroma cacao]